MCDKKHNAMWQKLSFTEKEKKIRDIFSANIFYGLWTLWTVSKESAEKNAIETKTR